LGWGMIVALNLILAEIYSFISRELPSDRIYEGCGIRPTPELREPFRNSQIALINRWGRELSVGK